MVRSGRRPDKAGASPSRRRGHLTATLHALIHSTSRASDPRTSSLSPVWSAREDCDWLSFLVGSLDPVSIGS